MNADQHLRKDMQSSGMEETSRTHLVNETIQAFVNLVLTQKFADMPVWLDFDLTVSQMKAIFRLAFYKELTVSELAKVLEMGNPAASILVQQLVLRGLVERAEDTKDRRRTLVRLTARGIELMSGRIEQREAKLRRWLSQMDADELAGMQRGLATLLEIVKSDT